MQAGLGARGARPGTAALGFALSSSPAPSRTCPVLIYRGVTHAWGCKRTPSLAQHPPEWKLLGRVQPHPQSEEC